MIDSTTEPAQAGENNTFGLASAVLPSEQPDKLSIRSIPGTRALGRRTDFCACELRERSALLEKSAVVARREMKNGEGWHEE
ncbi:MAG: hypothetical protein HZA64_15570 [Rhodocyclales bacterium]|nr:hypothetical protein [Rhodocyclales bacterium]